MEATLKIIKDFGGLGLSALIIWYFMSTLAPQMQQDQRELLSDLINKHDRGLTDLQKQTSEMLKERKDFAAERERGWKVIENLGETVEEHYRQAQRVWSTFRFLDEKTIQDITNQLIEQRKLDEQKKAE